MPDVKPGDGGRSATFGVLLLIVGVEVGLDMRYIIVGLHVDLPVKIPIRVPVYRGCDKSG